MKRKQRRYTDEQRGNAMVALTANGGNIERTARELGIPFTTLIHWKKQHRHPEATKTGDQKKESMADALERIAWQLVGKMPDAIDAGEIPFNQMMIGTGVAIDKMRLLREQSTNNLDHRGLSNLTDEELDRRIADAQSRLAGAAPRKGTAAGAK